AQALAAGVASTASAYSLSTEDAISAVASSQGLPASVVKEAVEKVAQYNYAKQVLAAKADEYNAGKAMLAAKQADYESGKAQLKEYELGSARYYDGKRAYEAGKKQLEEGAVALEEGKAKLEEAGKQLEEGKAKLADAEQQLKDGEKQLADGEKQLAAFEDGRAQVIDGLKTALGTGDVAERLGTGFDFMRDKENIDYAKAQQVVDAARAYAGDLTAAVTKELTNKAIASGATLFASLLAIIAGILGFAGKLPALGGLSVAALVAGAVGLILAFTAGDTYSAAAGATSANLLLAGGAADAVAGLLGTIGGLGAKKTPVS
ncbi:MAG: hypothetical protein IIZ49_05530, partial [Oscillospiraceae bacterium]|nr:hypothetical protein [Oscillospiraceae bacterium]